jgi:hypothetical protein
MTLGETPYNGTLSQAPARGLTSTNVASMSGRRGRGKARVNKRRPDTYCRANSECVSYYLDEDGNKVNGKVFKPSRSRKVHGTTVKAARLSHGHNYADE